MRLIIALVCACVANMAAAETLRIGIASNTWTFAPLQTGIDHGQFAAHGIEVEKLVFAGAAKLQQSMVAGAADIALSGSTDFVYLAKGAPEIAIAGFVGPPMGLGVIVAKPDYKTASDLKGRKIGVSSPNALTGWLALELARTQGWQPDDIQLVTLGGVIAAQGAALVTGQVDAIVSDTALGYQLEDAHQARLLFPSSAYAPGFLTNVMYASNAIAAANPDTLRRFIAAWFETVAWMRSHKAETVESARKITGLEAAVVSRQYDDGIEMFTRTGAISPAQLELVSRAVVEAGMTETRPELAPLYTDRFLPK